MAEQNNPETGSSEVEVRPLRKLPVRAQAPATGRSQDQGQARAQQDTIIDGEIVEINTAVVDDPALVNADAYAAWLYVVAPDDPATIDSLLDAAAYASLVGA